MLDYFKELIVYFISFGICLYACHSIDFSKFMKKGRVMETQVLYLIISMALAYLLGKFLIGIMFKMFI